MNTAFPERSKPAAVNESGQRLSARSAGTAMRRQTGSAPAVSKMAGRARPPRALRWIVQDVAIAVPRRAPSPVLIKEIIAGLIVEKHRFLRGGDPDAAHATELAIAYWYKELARRQAERR